MDFISTKLPPGIAGDVTIARFSGRDTDEKWLVSVNDNHFLTSRPNAEKIAALASSGADRSYDDAYRAYCNAALDPGTREHFIDWCERHRQRLEGLANTADTHALSYRRLLLSGPTCERVAAWLGWLFRPPVFAMVWIAALALIVVRTLHHEPHVSPGNYWLAGGLALFGVLLHEFGHVTACVRHGARQGGIGVGLYWIWPAFYADVRAGWVLGHVKRAVISLGGLYFQSIYLAALCAIELTAGHATVSMAIGISTLLMLTTLNPVFKYDGYWIFSDLLNVTNLHARISDHLRMLLVSDRATRAGLLRTQMTGVSAVFVVLAAGYILYLLAMMIGTVVGELGRLPQLWLVASSSITQHLPLAGEGGMSITRFLSALLGVAFLGLVICVLGYRSLQSARKVLVRP